MSNMIKKLLLLIIVAAVAGCGGGGGGSGFLGSSGAIRIGNGLLGNFQNGVLAIGIATLSSGGSTSITATVVDAVGRPYTATAVNVTFSSNCISLGKATVTSPVAVTNGAATTTYKAQGCSGNDVVTASASVPGGFISATGTINILPPILGSIEYVSSTPTSIVLKGSGGAGRSETSVVVFRVKDTSGSIVAGQSVTFSLNTTVGGLSLAPVSGFTDSQGLIQTAVSAGTVATAVRVTATLTGTNPAIRTQSNELVVSSGVPEQNSFSLSINKTLNPEAFDFDGETDVIAVLVGDHFHNPVPDGTAVAFTAEGGQIASSCTTVAGACTVTWTSSNPRPSDGRVSILATAIGNESFVDLNGNGRMDPGEPFTDLPEAWRDDNENGKYDPGEPFLDFNGNGVYDGPDGKYNGILCTDAANAPGGICDAPKSVNVRASRVIVMSGSTATITITPNPINLSVCSPFSFFSNQITPVTVRVRDARGQVMPKGTTIAVDRTNGTIIDKRTETIPNTTTASDYIFNLQSDASQTANTPTASTIAFSNTIYTIGEGSALDPRTAVITVNRNGSTNGTSTVNFSTADGPAPAATAGLDYTPTIIGTLTFAPGENVKTISVPILPDALVEPNENITLTLSNPFGATLGTATATLTILDASSATTQPTPTPPTGSSGTPFTCLNPVTTGVFTVTVTTPKGITTSASATVND